jgi:NADPH-dependent methylglyoxal reductase
MASTTIFVSGATGYIAKHIIKLSLSKGYKVVGSVRSAEKGDALKKQVNSENFTYEIVSSLTNPGAFDEALKKHPEVTVFMHTASPITLAVKDVEKDLLIPAIEGTKNALSAVKKYGPQIEKVVLTSSYVSITDVTEPVTHELTEDSWNPTTWEKALQHPMAAYGGSKTFAEKAAWDFLKEESPKFSLAVINPVYVFGPQAYDDDAKGSLNLTAEMIGSILKLGPSDDVPKVTGSFVDVRDVARAHILLFERDFSGTRNLLFGDPFSLAGALGQIRREFPELQSTLPNVSAEEIEKYDTVAKSQTDFINNEATKKRLGFKFTTFEETVRDSVKQILDANK